MSTSTPTISIVVPCFNEQPEVLERSLNSLKIQTFCDFECIVIDESTFIQSAEACKAICNSDERFRYIRPETRLGLAGSLNLGISAARGRYIARFDSDDICMPHRLEEQVLYLDNNPEIGVLGGHLAIVDENERFTALRHYPLNHKAIERRFHLNNAMAHPTVMMRRSVIEAHGAYDPKFKFAEDLELWLRLINKDVQFANIDSVLVHYRQQSSNRSASNWRCCSGCLWKISMD